MIKEVFASRYQRKMKVGRNGPLLLDAEFPDGTVVEVVAKFDAAECGRGGLAKEALCSLFAMELHLPVPEPLIVLIEDDFLDSLEDDHPEIWSFLSASGRKAFGSTYHAGWNVYPAGRPLAPSMLHAAAGAIYLDGMLFNADRVPGNPNCLVKNDALLLIDHELTLRNMAPYPWQPDGMDYMAGGGTEHLFISLAKGLGATAHEAAVHLSGVTPERQLEFMAYLPTEWATALVAQRDVKPYLELACTNASGIESEVQRILE